MVLTRSVDEILLERGRTETDQEVLESLYQGVLRMAQDSWSRSKESVIAPLTVASSRYGAQFMRRTREMRGTEGETPLAQTIILICAQFTFDQINHLQIARLLLTFPATFSNTCPQLS